MVGFTFNLAFSSLLGLLMSAVRERPAAAPAKSEAALLPVQHDSKPDWYDQPDDKAQLTTYLVTASKLVNGEDDQSDPPLRDPALITKAEFHAALMDSLANPIASRGSGRPRKQAAGLDIYMGVMEGLKDAAHHHAGLKIYKQKHTFLPFKLAMRQRHGIATHWSTSHAEFFSFARMVHAMNRGVIALGCPLRMAHLETWCAHCAWKS